MIDIYSIQQLCTPRPIQNPLVTHPLSLKLKKKSEQRGNPQQSGWGRNSLPPCPYTVPPSAPTMPPADGEYGWPPDKDGRVVIPDTVTSIGANTFQGCTGMTSVTIPSSVISIGRRAFKGCTGLASLRIPSSVTSIGAQAFYKCTGFTFFSIPSSVAYIGTCARPLLLWSRN